MKNLLCFSHYEFDSLCEKLGYSRENIPQDIAFISICGTPECQQWYLEETEKHYFPDVPNVLNLDFDDISEDSIEWKGHTFRGLSQEQAHQAVDFIEKNLGKDFWIHCRAGQSRSQGFVRFLLDCYPEESWKTREDNPCTTPNIDVVVKLKRAWRELV